MAVDPLETRRQRIVDALPVGAARTWSRTVGANTFAFTLANPQIRVLNGTRVFSVECTVTRNGTLLFDDRVNMPNPAVAIRGADRIPVDDPLQAIRDTLLDVVFITTRGGTQPRLERLANGQLKGDTLAVRSGTGDGRVTSEDATFATMCTGAGTLSSSTAAGTISPEWSLNGGLYDGTMFFLPFDTSSLTSPATITAAVLTLYGESTAEQSTDAYSIQAKYKAFATLDTGDWFDPRSPVWNALVAGGQITLSSWNQTNNTANNFSDSGVYSSISKTGTTEMVVNMSGANASTPTGPNVFTTYSADNAGTTSDPLFTVTYTLPTGMARNPSQRNQAVKRAARW